MTDTELVKNNIYGYFRESDFDTIFFRYIRYEEDKGHIFRFLSHEEVKTIQDLECVFEAPSEISIAYFNKELIKTQEYIKEQEQRIATMKEKENTINIKIQELKENFPEKFI